VSPMLTLESAVMLTLGVSGLTVAGVSTYSVCTRGAESPYWFVATHRYRP